MANDTFCLTFLFLSKMGFLSHNFGSRYASKPINNSKDTDYSLVYKKNALLDWRPAPGTLGQKGESMPPL